MNIANTIVGYVEGQPATIYGRVTQIRTLSKKLTFIVVEDTHASIQVGIRSANIPSKLDIVKVSGLMQSSKTGERTIWDDNPEIIVKNQGELPSHDGITNPEVAREKRHLQLLTNKEMRDVFVFRSQVVSTIRRFLDMRGFLEMETPILSKVASGANAKPFVTKSEALNCDLHLRIATEIPLKRCLIAGFERVYEIGRIFRNEGIDNTHNPEFTSIELYQSFAGLHEMRHLLLELLTELGVDVSNVGHFEYDSLVMQCGMDFEKQLIAPSFVFGQPGGDAPLCKLRADGRCDRFEFFMNGYEIANAYNELTDSAEQESRLAGKNDDGLVEALKYGMPPTGGMGIGIDRLIMCLKNIPDIRDVILFPTKRKAT
jgi:lysyl-tRNA synthetase class 2